MKSVLQDWVMELGLRHQGVLLSAVRGCDTVPKEDTSKSLVRCYRGMILNAHCGDPSKAASFIEVVDSEDLSGRFQNVLNNLDHYPLHYVMHLMHAAEIIGYKHPWQSVRQPWIRFYRGFCRKMHMSPETVEQLDARLDCSEEEFALGQK